MLVVIWGASLAVLALGALLGFRVGIAPELVAVHWPRVLLGAAAGMALAISGGLRAIVGAERPLRELELLALATGAAIGGIVIVGGRPQSATTWLLFVAGAVGGALLFWAGARQVDRPRRIANLGVALALILMAASALAADSFARARGDGVARVVLWLVGDLDRARPFGALAGAGAGVILLGAALWLDHRARQWTLALVAFGVGIGLGGPLAFVGAMVPLGVRALTRGASDRAQLAASAIAGAATVVAIDAVPRLLFGGYAFAWNFHAAAVAVPVVLLWNRARLRRLAGRAWIGYELVELSLIGIATAAGLGLALLLARLIRAAT